MSRWGFFKPYVNVAERRAKAARETAKLAKNGLPAAPVRIEGRTIAHTFWGEAWCDNLESYSDYENRLPRGRTYVRNGSVVDLKIEAGAISALVSGSELYRVKITIRPLAAKTWEAIRKDCTGKIGSLIELLRGKFDRSVMEIVTRKTTGLFPAPAEIDMNCSCPDWAGMCKHVAATLYGVGARLDHQPELLFKLRQVDHLELITAAGDLGKLGQGSSDRATIAEDALGDVFGIELENAAPTPTAIPAKPAKVEAPKAEKARRAPVEKKPVGRPPGAGKTAEKESNVHEAHDQPAKPRGRPKAVGKKAGRSKTATPKQPR